MDVAWVAEDADARAIRKSTRRAVRDSPGRLSEASFAIAVKSSRWETERSRPCRKVEISIASHTKYDRPIRFKTASERRTGEPDLARHQRMKSATSYAARAAGRTPSVQYSGSGASAATGARTSRYARRRPDGISAWSEKS